MASWTHDALSRRSWTATRMSRPSAVDAAYEPKYAHESASRTMQGGGPRSVTVRILPR